MHLKHDVFFIVRNKNENHAWSLIPYICSQQTAKQGKLKVNVYYMV